MMPCSVYCKIVRGEGFSGRAKETERDWEKRKELELTEVIRIVRRYLQVRRIPMSKFVQPSGALM
jgi:hypothetical protein